MRTRLARVDNFIQPEPRVGSFVYRNAEKVYLSVLIIIILFCFVCLFLNTVDTKNCNHFSRTFQGTPTKTIISQQILQKCTFPAFLLHQLLYTFQFTCLKLIFNYCTKHRALKVNNL